MRLSGLKAHNHLAVHWPAYFLLLTALVVGVLNFKDYGVTWDEPSQRKIGRASYNYVLYDDDALHSFKDRDYGVAIELPLIAIEEFLGLSDERSILLMRRLVLHLLFLVGCWSMYALSYRLFSMRWVAVFALLALLLHPRLYAHSFFNTKDIPFMVAGLLCLNWFHLAFSRGKWYWFAALGLGTGILMNLRIMGVLLYVLCLAFGTIQVFLSRGRRIYLGGCLALFAVLSLGTLVVTWPYLWESPWDNFVRAFENMKKFRWNEPVLFNGEVIRPNRVPWFYTPRWLSITTPLAVLVSGVGGLVLVLGKGLIRPVKSITSPVECNMLLYAAYFTGPLVAVAVFHSKLYDGWRQMYFIYPAFVLLAAYCVHAAASGAGKIRAGWMLFILGGAQLGLVLPFMYASHPQQNVYFNELVAFEENELRRSWEMDYWGTSYRGALEYILAHDERAAIRVNVANTAGVRNYIMLRPEEKARLHVSKKNEIGEADYFVSNYRWNREGYVFDEAEEVYSLRLYGSPVVTVWQRKRDDGAPGRIDNPLL